MKAALGKLEGAMLVRRVLPTSSTSAPIEVKARSAPKLLPLDLGLASSAWGLQRKDLSAGGLNGAIDGRAAEVFVGLELLAHALTVDSPLYFWVRESSRANSELDYLVPNGRELAPVEVKAGATGSLKSLHQFLWRAGASCGIRLSTGPLRDERHQVVMPDGLMEYRLLSLPLYLAGELTEVVEALATWNDRS
jgi:hypothetical protein